MHCVWSSAGGILSYIRSQVVHAITSDSKVLHPAMRRHVTDLIGFLAFLGSKFISVYEHETIETTHRQCIPVDTGLSLEEH